MIKHFSDIFFYKKNRTRILIEIDKIIKSDIYTNGNEVSKFEKKFSQRHKKKYCVAVNSGTSALFLALSSCGIRNKDEVITTALSFVATPMSINYLGASPVFVDIDKNSWNIDVNKIEKKINSKTKAILPVHLHGLMCDMKPIYNLAKKYNLKVIEDASQAAGSLYNQKKPGHYSDICTYSFFPTKNLGTYGEGGAIITDNFQIYKKCKELRNWGRKYNFDEVSYNFRMSEISALILNTKIKFFKDNILERQFISDFYKNNLDIDPLKLSTYNKKFSHSYHIFAIRIDKRDNILANSKKYGIEFKCHYPYYLPNIKLYRDNNKKNDFVNSSRISKELISLPIYPGLSKQNMKFVIESINSIINK